MKVLVTFAAVMCYATLPAYSADGQLSQSSLARLGLSGMTPISDGQGLEVRGMGMMQAMGMNSGYGNSGSGNSGYGDNQHDHDMYDDGHKHDMDKDHKHDMHGKDHKDHNKDHKDMHHEHQHQHEHQHNYGQNQHGYGQNQPGQNQHGQNQFNCHFGSKSNMNMNFGNMCSHVHGCKG
jgi:hypothetical protein